MKKLTLLLSAMLLACATSVWAKTATYQHVFTTKPSTGDNITLSGVSWNIAATNLGAYNSNNYAGVQFGTKTKDGSITLTSSSDWNYNDTTRITEVRLWLNLGGTSVTPSVTIGGKPATSDGTKVTQNKNAGADWTQATKVTFTPAADGNTGVVVISVTSEKAGYICAMEIDSEYEEVLVAAPVLTAEDGKVAGGDFVEAFQLTMTCETEEATILYTLDESDPKTSETAQTYTAAITISETTTVRAIAKAGEEWSREATKTYTKLVALTTMDEIFATATEAGKNTVTKYVTFNDWVVTGVKGSNAYLTDGTKGLIIYTSEHGFVAGDMLSGTVSCDITLYNGSAEIKGLTASTNGLTVAQGGTAPVQTPAIKDLSAINTGSIISLSNLTYDGSVLTDADDNAITPYNAFITLPKMTSGKKYNVKGVFINFGKTKEIAPLAERDIQEVTTPSAIDNAAVETPAVKTIENGQLVILRDGVKYNAMGVRLQ